MGRRRRTGSAGRLPSSTTATDSSSCDGHGRRRRPGQSRFQYIENSSSTVTLAAAAATATANKCVKRCRVHQQHLRRALASSVVVARSPRSFVRSFACQTEVLNMPRRSCSRPPAPVFYATSIALDYSVLTDTGKYRRRFQMHFRCIMYHHKFVSSASSFDFIFPRPLEQSQDFTTPQTFRNTTIYRDEINFLQIQLSRTQAGPGKAVKEQQEQNSPNHVQRINLISVEQGTALKVGQIFPLPILLNFITLLKCHLECVS